MRVTAPLLCAALALSVAPAGAQSFPTRQITLVVPFAAGGSNDVIARVIGARDSFNIPLIFLVDQPGFMIGAEGEKRWAPGRIMNWMNAVSLVTVPKISVILRKSYGQAYLNMGGGRNSDEVLCWPTADLGFVAPSVGVNIVHGLKREDDPERFDRLRQEIEQDSSAWALAALYEAHAVIDPRDTRSSLKRLLDVHCGPGVVGRHQLANWPTSY